MLIYLNPGHDRELDSGAVNPNNGAREADVVWNVTMEVMNNVHDRLIEAGHNIVCSQSDDLDWVVDNANNIGADIFVSIHCNAFNGVAKGTEVEAYSFNSEGASLAQIVNDSIVNRLGTVNRGVKERPGLFVLRTTDMPSILIEMAFIDNDEDCKLLLNNADDFAIAIADGINEYLGTPVVETGDDRRRISPNGTPYEQNDIDYLVNKGYSINDALYALDQTEKYGNTDIQKAAEYADSRVGSTGYGNNGCTAWVKDFLQHANSWFGDLMEDGSQGNLMWVPNIMDYAKEHGMWKEPSEGGCIGDICLLETNYCKEDGPDHVVIACGDGNYWGNSSSRNKIVKSSIAGDYGASNVWGYVSTGSKIASSVVNGDTTRSAEEIVGDAGSTSYVNLAPNGRVYEENDIKYLLSKDYTIEQAIETLSKDAKYTTPLKKAPNGKYYEYNDVLYLKNNCYTDDAAYATLSMCDKYRA